MLLLLCVFTPRFVVYLRISVYVAEPNCSFPYIYSVILPILQCHTFLFVLAGGKRTGCCSGRFPCIFLPVPFPLDDSWR
uniref:Uncharacterized protein n=1 Tax=Triticum urartu TaxID=4572 RepID=A0A8R7TQ04_TRIUA